MSRNTPAEERYRKSFVLLMVLAISATFIAMVREFIIGVMMAGIFTALLYPLYRRLEQGFRGHSILASITMLLLIVLAVGIPLLVLIGVVATEALQISKAVKPWIETQIQTRSGVSAALPSWLPFAEELEPYRSQILTKLGEVASTAGQFLVRSVSAITRGTVAAMLHGFILLYSMFFFFLTGPRLLETVMQYIPLREADRELILHRGVSVTRATLKGILIIGVTQGVMVGLAFWATGIQGPAFWGTVVVVLSAIPGLGAPLIWVPAVVFLVANGEQAAAVGLTIWGVVVVGMVDNVLRPRIVGGDTKMPDLLVLLSTLGGLTMFGAIGIIVGPILAGVWITALDIYHEAFADQLPKPAPVKSGPHQPARKSRRSRQTS